MKRSKSTAIRPHADEDIEAWARGMLLRVTTDAEGVLATIRAVLGALERKHLRVRPPSFLVEKPAPRTEDEREREAYGDFDGLAEAFADLLELPREQRVVVMRRAAELQAVRCRTEARRAPRQVNEVHAIDLTTRGH